MKLNQYGIWFDVMLSRGSLDQGYDYEDFIIPYNFKQLSDLANLEDDSAIDVATIVYGEEIASWLICGNRDQKLAILRKIANWVKQNPIDTFKNHI